MTNTEAIKILFHIANSLVEEYAPEKDKETYNQAIEKAVDALSFERVINLKANRKKEKVIGTFWNGQISHKEKDFRLQFQTDDYEKYKQVEKLCQKLIDKRP